VGPSIAAGSQGWRPNWADLPVAASRHPQTKSEVLRLEELKRINTASKFHLEEIVSIQPALRSIPMSPNRL